MISVLETFCIDFVDALRSGRTRCEPAASSNHFQAADRCLVARARCVSLAMIGSSASFDAVIASGESFASLAFCSAVAGASRRSYSGSPNSAVSLR